MLTVLVTLIKPKNSEDSFNSGALLNGKCTKIDETKVELQVNKDVVCAKEVEQTEAKVVEDEGGKREAVHLEAK